MDSTIDEIIEQLNEYIDRQIESLGEVEKQEIYTSIAEHCVDSANEI